MNGTNIYINPARQEDRRKQREKEKQKQAAENAMAAGQSAYDPGDSLCLEQDEIIANVNEWQRKAELAAAKAEQYAQNALTAESRGDMGAAAFLWGDSRKSDLKAKNYSKEALRYESMLQPPDTAPKPMSVKPAKAPKMTTPAVTIESGETEAPAAEETVAAAPASSTSSPTLQELVTAYSAEREAILETAEKRHVLEWGNAALKDQQVWQYIQHSGGNPDLEGLAMLMDAALAEYRTPTRSAKMDYAKRSVNQIFLGNYTDDVTPAGTAGQMALGFTGADIFMDARDLSYDLTHLRTISPGQLAIDAAALLPVVGWLKYADEAGVLWKQGLNAAEAAGDMTKQVDDLVDAGGELVYNGAKQLGDIELMPADLMEELAQSGVKYTPEDVLMVTKNSDGKLMWLETGNENSGLTHILERHERNFERCGIESENIQEMLRDILKTESIKNGYNKSGPYSVYTYNGQDYLVAYGDNGYIVSFYPYTID